MLPHSHTHSRAVLGCSVGPQLFGRMTGKHTHREELEELGPISWAAELMRKKHHFQAAWMQKPLAYFPSRFSEGEHSGSPGHHGLVLVKILNFSSA